MLVYLIYVLFSVVNCSFMKKNHLTFLSDFVFYFFYHWFILNGIVTNKKMN